MRSVCFTVLCLLCLPVKGQVRLGPMASPLTSTVPYPRDHAFNGEIHLRVDATDTDHGVVRVLFKAQVKAALNPDRNEAHERVYKASGHNAALCVRKIDADLLQLAQDARISHPVPDLLTLKANVPLNTAQRSFQAGRYGDAIAQSQAALAIKPELADAYWAIGISTELRCPAHLRVTGERIPRIRGRRSH